MEQRGSWPTEVLQHFELRIALLSIHLPRLTLFC
jgi:hypothetical protein